jgi:hypothetical protein
MALGALERRLKIATLRTAGDTWSTVGQKLGISTPAKLERIRKDFYDWLAVQKERAASALRREQSDQIGLMIEAHLPTATDRGNPRAAESAAVVIRCWDRAAKLYGLDAPQQTQMIVENPHDREPPWILAVVQAAAQDPRALAIAEQLAFLVADRLAPDPGYDGADVIEGTVEEGASPGVSVESLGPNGDAAQWPADCADAGPPREE